jgi:hypothetical protein
MLTKIKNCEKTCCIIYYCITKINERLYEQMLNDRKIEKANQSRKQTSKGSFIFRLDFSKNSFIFKLDFSKGSFIFILYVSIKNQR